MMGEQASDAPAGLAEEEIQRARFYALLSTLLARPPDTETLSLLRTLEGDDSPFGLTLCRLAERARALSAESVEEEFGKLFFGVGAGGELLPYASHYLSGLLYDRPLADLRRELRALELSADPETTEPEDHIATVLEVMHLLVLGHHGGDEAGCQQTFFNTHLMPWAPTFFTDLEQADSAFLYAPVGTLGGLLMEIERQAFEMAA